VRSINWQARLPSTRRTTPRSRSATPGIPRAS
jgi:hypothetical protein